MLLFFLEGEWADAGCQLLMFGECMQAYEMQLYLRPSGCRTCDQNHQEDKIALFYVRFVLSPQREVARSWTVDDIATKNVDAVKHLSLIFEYSTKDWTCRPLNYSL